MGSLVLLSCPIQSSNLGQGKELLVPPIMNSVDYCALSDYDQGNNLEAG